MGKIFFAVVILILFGGCGDDSSDNCNSGETKYEATGPDEGSYWECFDGYWIPLLQPEVPIIGPP
jgi:hypothetical protein